MKFYIGNTDLDWYRYLKSIDPEVINFWQPGGLTHFRAVEEGAPFLLRLKSPINKVAGIGFFSIHSILPIDFAWEVFQNRNGAESFQAFYAKIRSYRDSENSIEKNPHVGCIVLTNPIFFTEADWLPVPSDDVEISKKIKEEFENGRDYYKYHGQKLISLPKNPFDIPNR